MGASSVCALQTSFFFAMHSTYLGRFYFIIFGMRSTYVVFILYFIIGFHSRSGCLLAWREKGPACLDGKVASNILLVMILVSAGKRL